MPPTRNPPITVIVENIGPIRHAAISARDFSVLLGKNNAGKSILCEVMFASVVSHYEAVRIAKDSTRLTAFPSRIAPSVNGANDSKAIEEILDSYAENLATSWVVNFRKNYRDAIRERLIPNLELVFAEKLKDLLPLRGKGGGVIQFECKEGSIFYSTRLELISSVKTRVRVTVRAESRKVQERIAQTLREGRLGDYLKQMLQNYRAHSPKVSDTRILRRVRFELADLVFRAADSGLWSFARTSDAYYVPAGRAGLVEGWNTVAQALVSLGPLAAVQHIDIPAIPGPASRFYRLLLGLRGRPGRFSSVVKAATTGLVSGRIYLSKGAAPTKKILYEFKDISGAVREIDVINSSSMVKELAPLLLIVAERVRPGDVLIVEEPESHLHPEVQLLLVQLLFKLASKRVRVLITSHSSDLIVKASHLVKQTSSSADLHSALYLLDETSEGTVTKEISFSPPLEVPPFDKIARTLHEEELKVEQTAR